MDQTNQPVTVSFPEIVKSWAEASKTRTDRAYNTKGGWETWAQVDLALHAKKKYAGAVNVEREQLVYEGNDTDSRLRVDFVLRTGNKTEVAELKVELQGDGQALKAMPRFEKDITKAQQPLRNPYQNAQVYAVVIAVTDGCKEHFKTQISNLGKGAQDHYTELGAGIFVWRRNV